MAEWVELGADIATIVAGILVLPAVFIGLAQLRATTKARELESMLVIMRYVDDITLRRARYFMFEHGSALSPLLKQPYSLDARRAVAARVRELSEGSVDLHEIDLAINALNNVSFLIHEGHAPRAAVETFMKNSLLHAWRAFEEYVKHRRTRPDQGGHASIYGVHLEWAAAVADKHK